MSELVKVMMPKTHGAKMVGDWKPGDVREVEAEEAARLIKVKGFVAVTKQIEKQLAKEQPAETVEPAAAAE